MTTDPDVEAMRARKDAAYTERSRCVALLVTLGLLRGWRGGRTRTDIPGWHDDWHGCVYLETPQGQVSWHFHDSHAHLFEHLPVYDATWDGHTTDVKYERVGTLVRRLLR